MKIYLCSSCNKTVPLKDLAEHRKTCGADAELTIKADWKMKARRVWAHVLSVIALIALSVGAIFMGKGSFKSIAEMRALERVPATEVQAVLPGEINLTGTAQILKSTLKGPKTGKQCLYYRYVVEKRTRDSDGDTKWETIKDEKKWVAFRLKDDSGIIALRPSNQVKFHSDKSYYNQEGDRRYTEYRIDPGDNVFTFGFVVPAGNVYEVRYDQPGHYTPIISERGEARERVGMASLSVGLCWGGLVCLAFAAGLLAWLLRLHRLLVYFMILSCVVAIYLCVFGVKMMKADLESGLARLESHEQAARAVISQGMGSRWQGDWTKLGEFSSVPGLGSSMQRRLERIRLDYAVAVRRFQAQRGAFPERLFAKGWGIPARPDLPLPESQQAKFAELVTSFEKAAMPPMVGWIITGVACLLGIGLVVAGFRRVRFKRCIENLPTSKTAGAAYGLCELKGVVQLAENEEPLSGPLSSQPCVQYHYVVKEKRGSGKNSKWVTIVNERRTRPFLCTDSEGSMKVVPEGAKIYTEHCSSRRFGRRRFTETRLELNDPLYAIGECVIDQEKGDELLLQKPEGDYPFILSNMTENRVMHKVATAGVVFLNFAFSAFLLTALVLFGLSGSFAATDYLASALVTPGFMIMFMLVLHYNDLVFLRERADRNWANIDVSLKKRHDLIPNLEQVVKSYMDHESGLQQSIAEMRSSYDKSASRDPDNIGKFMEAEHHVAKSMLGLVENYPELKADQTVSLLMRNMVSMENEIAFMRMGYNQAVETYNTRTAVFPDVIFAKMFKFEEKSFITAESEVIRMPVSVQDAWEESQTAAAAPAAETPDAAPEGEAASADTPVPPPVPARTEEQEKEAMDARAVIYALLLNTEEDVQQAQLEAIASAEAEGMKDKTVSLITAVAQEITDPVNRLRTAEEWMPKLEHLKPSEYRTFSGIVRQLIEQDADISLFEYALGRSISRRLDPVFEAGEEKPVRYQDLSLITDAVSMVLSRLSHAEEAPADTAQAAFAEGVAVLAHEAKTEFVLQPADACTLAAFDNALDEIALAAESVKQNVLDACTKLVVLNDDYTWDQAMLVCAAADALSLPRPEWM